MKNEQQIEDLLDEWEDCLAKDPNASLKSFYRKRNPGFTRQEIAVFRKKAVALAKMNKKLKALQETKKKGETPLGGTDNSVSLSRFEAGFEPIAGYKLVKRLGAGGFGEVWEATGPGGLPLALKFVRAEGRAGDLEQRALKIMREVRHPNLLSIFGTWSVGEFLIIATELADCTLLDRFNESVAAGYLGIPPDELREYMIEAAKGIDYLNEPGSANRSKIQHRDIKPQNLLLSGGSVKVGDFGLARSLQSNDTGHTGSLTLAYAAPEFLEGKTSSRSDQYSLAITYCYLCTGKFPFEGTEIQIIDGHRKGKPDLSMIIESERPIIEKALAKNPDDRWGSCTEFVKAISSEMRLESSNRVPKIPPLHNGSPQVLEPDDFIPISPNTEIPETPSKFQRLKLLVDSIPLNGKARRKLIKFGAITITLLILYMCRNQMASMIPGFSELFGSYKRGVGDTILKYEDRSYKGAKWEELRDAISLAEVIPANSQSPISLKSITGWDDDTFCVTAKYNNNDDDLFLWHNDGKWLYRGEVKASYSGRPYSKFIDINSIAYFGDQHVAIVSPQGIVECSNNQVRRSQISIVSKDIIYFFGDHDKVFKFSEGKFQTWGKDSDKEVFVHRKDNTPLREYPIGRIRATRTFSNGNSVGIASEKSYGRNPIIVRLENGTWYEVEKLRNETPFNSVWIGGNSTLSPFIIFVGNEGDVLVHKIGDGQVKQKITNAPNGTSVNLIAVWGVSPEKYWVMDDNGTVWERSDNKWQTVVKGLYSESVKFTDAWVSPTGTILAITGDTLYRLN